MNEAPLKLPEISDMTGVPISTLRWMRATNSGGPKTFVLAGRVVAFRADVEAWVQAQYDAAGTGRTV